jgi:succinyl-CoA synthetase alpha subunit
LVAGREAKQGVAMGHAGALTYGAMGTLASKHDSLQRAGAQVFPSIAALVDTAASLLSREVPAVETALEDRGSPQ